MIKHLIPEKLRRFIWFIRKAPQRKWIGKGSLKTDINAYWSVFVKRKQYHRITVCVGVKNRSSNLLNCLIESLNKASFRPLIDLAVFDCGSTDSPDLHEAIKKRWKGSLSYQRIEQPFSRSVAFNRAVGLSSTDYILICDADMSVPKDIVYKVSKYCSEKASWFPVCWYENEDGSGRFWTESTGMFACKRENFDKTGGFDETIKTWGKEDWLMYFSFYKQGIGCIRTRERQFVHHYHESLMPSDFKPLF